MESPRRIPREGLDTWRKLTIDFDRKGYWCQTLHNKSSPSSRKTSITASRYRHSTLSYALAMSSLTTHTPYFSYSPPQNSPSHNQLGQAWPVNGLISHNTTQAQEKWPRWSSKHLAGLQASNTSNVVPMHRQLLVFFLRMHVSLLLGVGAWEFRIQFAKKRVQNSNYVRLNWNGARLETKI
jgi:hypothetical protein